MKLVCTILFSLFLMLGCTTTSTNTSAQGDAFSKTPVAENIVEITGTFIREDETPASGVRINIFEKDNNGKMMNYPAIATASGGGIELIFQCPGTGITDEDGILNCSVNVNKFVTKEKRFMLVAQYQDPVNPNESKMPRLSVDNPDSILSLLNQSTKINLNDILGKIVVSGI